MGCRSEIKNILQALAFLGMERVNSLIVTTAMRGLVGPASANLARACWRHNLATAVICERLASTQRISQERGYMAGLIHDIGRLALLRAFPNYEAALTEAAAGGRNLQAIEKGLYGMDHSEAGRWLLSQWGCPLDLQIVCSLHENPAAATGRDKDLVNLVGAASLLADLTDFCEFENPKGDVAKVVEMLPEAKSQLSDIDTFGEAVATRVNGIELSLG
jgi:HD-like signal output (HDOD) protein